VRFVEASTRVDYVNGTRSSPVAFLEGLYVAPKSRREIDRESRWAPQQFQLIELRKQSMHAGGIVGRKASNHRLERTVNGLGWRAASALRYFRLASRWTRMRRPLNLIVRRRRL